MVAATRARFHQILIPTSRRYVFSKQYGDIAELKITFPAGVTKEILSLKVQVMFPCSAIQLAYELIFGEFVFTVGIGKYTGCEKHVKITKIKCISINE